MAYLGAITKGCNTVNQVIVLSVCLAGFLIMKSSLLRRYPALWNKNGVSFLTFNYFQLSFEKIATVFCPPLCHYLTLKVINPRVMRTTASTYPPPPLATISLCQTCSKVTNPSVMETTAVMLRNSMRNWSLMVLSCQSWPTNSWCVSAWGGGGGSSRPHVIDWHVRGENRSFEVGYLLFKQEMFIMVGMFSFIIFFCGKKHDKTTC